MAVAAGGEAAVSSSMFEFEDNCTLLVQRSHHHYTSNPALAGLGGAAAAAAALNQVSGANVAVAAQVALAAVTGSSVAVGSAQEGVGDRSGGLVPVPAVPNLANLQQRLEHKSLAVKYQALKEVVLWGIQPVSASVEAAATAAAAVPSGPAVASKLLMSIIRFVLPACGSDHRICRMLHIYWELVDKYRKGAAGGGAAAAGVDLREELILVSNHFREDLLHPNEFVRGTTLRLLARLADIRKLVEPLVSAVMANLGHHHAFVRRNALLCILALIRSSNGALDPFAENGADADGAAAEGGDGDGAGAVDAAAAGAAAAAGLVGDDASDPLSLVKSESDVTARRNALLLLKEHSLDRAIAYAAAFLEDGGGEAGGDAGGGEPGVGGGAGFGAAPAAAGSSSSSFVNDGGGIFQLALLDVVRAAIAAPAASRSPALPGLLQAVAQQLPRTPQPPAVRYACGATLAALAASPAALAAATRAYVSLLASENDVSMRLAVVDRLADVADPAVLAACLPDLARAMDSPSYQVRRKTLALVLQAVTPESGAAVQRLLRRELERSLAAHEAPAADLDRMQAQRAAQHEEALVRALRTAAACSEEGADAATLQLLPALYAHKNEGTATEAAEFARELCAQGRAAALVPEAVAALPELRGSRVARVLLWALGEFVDEPARIAEVVDAIYGALLPLESLRPGDGGSAAGGGGAGAAEPARDVQTKFVVLPDGSYGAENFVVAADGAAAGAGAAAAALGTPFRQMLIAHSDFLLAATVATVLCKLALRLRAANPAAAAAAAAFAPGASAAAAVSPQPPLAPPLAAAPQGLAILRSVAVCAALLAYCEKHVSRDDTSRRVRHVLALLTSRDAKAAAEAARAADAWFPSARAALNDVVRLEAKALAADKAAPAVAAGGGGGEGGSESRTAPSDGVAFRQLGGRRPVFPQLSDDAALSVALGRKSLRGVGPSSRRLERVKALSGFSDPIYVEAAASISQLDLVIDFLLINRCDVTLQDVCLELAVHGDLKVIERPAATTLAAGGSHRCHAIVKVSSVEFGIVFGHVAYTMTGRSEQKMYLELDECPVDVIDFVGAPAAAPLDELAFRHMWREFEWENKLTITPLAVEPEAFLQDLLDSTKMSVVAAPATEDDCAAGGGSAGRESGAGDASDAGNAGAAASWRSVDLSAAAPGKPRPLTPARNSNFLVVSLHSRSIFGEDALANVSLARGPDGALAGSIRIRSRSQGIALSLGDRVTLLHRKLSSRRQR